jgi:hypothetical protein
MEGKKRATPSSKTGKKSDVKHQHKSEYCSFLFAFFYYKLQKLKLRRRTKNRGERAGTDDNTDSLASCFQQRCSSFVYLQKVQITSRERGMKIAEVKTQETNRE